MSAIGKKLVEQEQHLCKCLKLLQRYQVASLTRRLRELDVHQEADDYLSEWSVGSAAAIGEDIDGRGRYFRHEETDIRVLDLPSAE
tara:strand:+ start:632 stop:889 length:258 start_codon:yes stop_codon:yes gene_type:complete